MKHEETARRLKDALNRKNMKAQELSDKSGVSKASISQYMNGVHAPNNISSAKMAKILDVDPLWLMGLSDHMNREEMILSKKPDFIAQITENDELYDVIEMYSKLNEHDKEFIKALIRKMS